MNDTTQDPWGAERLSPQCHTITSSTPPPQARGRCRTIWPERFAEARSQPGRWVRVLDPMTEGTAAQVASDIRSSHRRDVRKMRMTGIVQGERWEAAFGQDETDPDQQHFYVWMSWISPA